MNFLIYSLPRSGSAWLANLLTNGSSFCYHELLADVAPANLESRLQQRAEKVVGSVETGLYQIEAFQPKVRTFALYRDLDAIIDSSSKLGFHLDFQREYDRFLHVTQHMPIFYYDKLFDLDYLASLWKQVVGEGFDRERAEYLIETNVQRDVAAVIRRMAVV